MDNYKTIQALEEKIGNLQKELDKKDNAAQKEKSEKTQIENVKAVMESIIDNASDKEKRNIISNFRSSDNKYVRKAIESEERWNNLNSSENNTYDKYHTKNGNEIEKLGSKILRLNAIVKSFEIEKRGKMIAELKELKSNIVTNFDSERYEKKLQSMDFNELKSMHNERKDEIKIMQEQAKKGNLGLVAKYESRRLTSINDILNSMG